MLFQQQRDRYGVASNPILPYLKQGSLPNLGYTGVSVQDFAHRYGKNAVNGIYGDKRPFKTRYDMGSSRLTKW